MLAVNFLPLAVASSGLMSAVFVTMILGYITADEIMTWREITTIVFGLIGVIIVLNPSWFTDGPSLTSVQLKDNRTHSKGDYFLGIIFCGGFAITSAFKYITIRAIGDNVHTSVKNYYFGVIGCIFTVIANIFMQPEWFAIWKIGTPEYVMSPSDFGSALAVGVLGYSS